MMSMLMITLGWPRKFSPGWHLGRQGALVSVKVIIDHAVRARRYPRVALPGTTYLGRRVLGASPDIPSRAGGHCATMPSQAAGNIATLPTANQFARQLSHFANHPGRRAHSDPAGLPLRGRATNMGSQWERKPYLLPA